MEPGLKSFGLRLKIWLWKSEREDDKMSRDNRRIGTYFTTPRIHKEIKNHELATQGNPSKRFKKKRYISPPKEST